MDNTSVNAQSRNGIAILAITNSPQERLKRCVLRISLHRYAEAFVADLIGSIYLFPNRRNVDSQKYAMTPTCQKTVI